MPVCVQPLVNTFICFSLFYTLDHNSFSLTGSLFLVFLAEKHMEEVRANKTQLTFLKDKQLNALSLALSLLRHSYEASCRTITNIIADIYIYIYSTNNYYHYDLYDRDHSFPALFPNLSALVIYHCPQQKASLYNDKR